MKIQPNPPPPYTLQQTNTIERIVLLDFIHRLVSQEQRKLKIIDQRPHLMTEAEPVSETLCRYFYKLFGCVPLCVCVYFILVFWPPLRVLVCV
jgi:hypothetical protein